MQPRGTTWPASVQLDVPRDLTGTGEYVRLLAEVRPAARPAARPARGFALARGRGTGSRSPLGVVSSNSRDCCIP